MTDTYYAINAIGEVENAGVNLNNITVGSSAASSKKIEVRITDGAMTAKQAYLALELLADIFATRNMQIIPTDTIG